MASFGDSLRQERLRKQITLDQVAEATKINQRFLQAIEEETLQVLPGGVFNRNFVRSYARYLGLNEEQYVEEYIRATGDSAQPSALPHPPAGSSEPLISGSTLLALLIAGIVVMVAWAGLHLYQEQPRQQAVASAPAAQTATPPQAAARPLIPPPAGAVPASEPSQAVQRKTPAPATAPPTSEPGATLAPVASSSMTAGPAAAADMVIPPTPAGKMSLVVAATRQPAWIQIFTDGHWRLEATLEPGQYRVVFFRQSVRVNSGNAGATEVRINGKPQGTLGKIGMVAHFVWPEAAAAPADGATPPR